MVWRAITRWDIGLLNSLIRNWLGLTRGKHGDAPLAEAARNGSMDIVEALLADGADTNKANKDRATALMYAAEYGHTEIVEALIAGGADINKANKDGSTALMYAARDGRTEIVKALILKGANVDLTDKNMRRALYSAIHFGHEKVLALLLGYSKEKDSQYQVRLLTGAVKGNNPRIVEMIVRNGFDLSSTLWNPLPIFNYALSHNAAPATVQALIDGGLPLRRMTLRLCLLPGQTFLHKCRKYFSGLSNQSTPRLLMRIGPAIMRK
jgi:ankyrin repeat protein